MKVKATVLTVLAILLGMMATPVYAGVPPLPHAFYGTLEVNGSDAEPGYRVKAQGIGVAPDIEGNPITTEFVGEYGQVGPLQPKLIVQGDIADGAEIEFYVSVDGVTWVEAETDPASVLWHSGEITRVDLSATIAEPISPGGGGGGGGGTPDTTAPIMSNISASTISETAADISWRTNEASTSQVEYWASPSKFSPLDETMVYNHLVHLTDLTPGTTYHYKTMSKDAAGNVAVSDEDTFKTLGEAPDAIFTTRDLSISPTEVNIGETVTITLSVTNTGTATGSYKVTLKVKGVVEATREVTLDAVASKEVTFTTSKDKAATYSVDVNGLSGSFKVKEKVVPAPAPAQEPEPAPPAKPPVNWPVVGGIIGGVIVVGLAILFLVRRRAA